jgi:hypothetical protein
MEVDLKLVLQNQVIIMEALQQIVGLDQDLLVQIQITKERLEDERTSMARTSEPSI